MSVNVVTALIELLTESVPVKVAVKVVAVVGDGLLGVDVDVDLRKRDSPRK